MAKNKTEIHVTTVFDGELDATDVLSLIHILVKLPTWEYGKENAMTSKISWGEVSPGEWGNYITLQEKAEPVFLSCLLYTSSVI